MSPDRAGERGSALMLVPASVLVLLVLSALAVDAAIVFSAERRLADAAAAAANDAAVVALSAEAFQRCGRLRVDRAAAAMAARSGFFAAASGLAASPTVTVRSGARGEQVEVVVTARGTVAALFSSALPGGASRRTVDATAVVTAETDPTLATGRSTCGEADASADRGGTVRSSRSRER